MSLLIVLQRGKEELSQKGAGIKKETADNIKYKTHYLLVCLTRYTRWCNLCLGNITLNGINLSWFGLFKRIPTNVTQTRDRDHLELVTSERRNVGHRQGYLERISKLAQN